MRLSSRTVADSGYMPQAIRLRTARAIRARGVGSVMWDYARWGSALLAGLPWTLRGTRGSFTFMGDRHAYRFHPYLWSWLGERAVEVPIAQALVDRNAGKRILEVGNVLSHFSPQRHLVVDKYENAPGVVNRDVLALDDLGEFDLIVTISTIEHVGRDEEPRDASKAPEALRRLQRLLAPGGTLLVTIPIGYHDELDMAVQQGELGFTRTSAMQRTGQTRWREVLPEQVWGTPYDFLLYCARAVFFGWVERPASG